MPGCRCGGRDSPARCARRAGARAAAPLSSLRSSCPCPLTSLQLPHLRTACLPTLRFLRRVQALVPALRIKELNECLERLGLKKTGNKAELQRRLLSVFENAAM